MLSGQSKRLWLLMLVVLCCGLSDINATTCKSLCKLDIRNRQISYSEYADSSSVQKRNLLSDAYPAFHHCYDSLNHELAGLMTRRDTLEVTEILIEGFTGKHSDIFDLGPLVSRIQIIRTSETDFQLSYYVNLPLVSVDSFYVPTEILQLMVHVIDSGACISVNPNFNLATVETLADSTYALARYDELLSSATHRADIFNMPDSISGEVMELYYALFYASLTGCVSCAARCDHFEENFPAMDQLTLHMDLYSTHNILYYYGLLDHPFLW